MKRECPKGRCKWYPFTEIKDAANKMKAFTSEYTCLFWIASAVPGLKRGSSTLVIGKPISFLVFIGLNEDAYFFLYKKMSERHQWPDSPRFSKVEAEDLANSNLSSKITDTVTFGDIWQRRKTFALVPMEEGVLKNWSWERIAVCGDAAHKVSFLH